MYQIEESKYGSSSLWDDTFDHLEMTEANDMTVGEVYESGVRRILYTYDMGGGWEQDIILNEPQEPKPKVDYPELVVGKRNCPPEDVGGVRSYYDYLEAIKDPLLT